MMKIMPTEFPSRAEDPDQGVLMTDEIAQDQEEDADHHLSVEDGPDQGLAEETALDLEPSRKEEGQTLLFNRNCCNLHKEEEEV